jgi:hypothetical protein
MATASASPLKPASAVATIVSPTLLASSSAKTNQESPSAIKEKGNTPTLFYIHDLFV